MIKQHFAVLLLVLASSQVHADDATSAHVDRLLTREAESAHRMRMVTGGTVLAVGGFALGVGVYSIAVSSANHDPNVTVKRDAFSKYGLLGGSALSIAAGAFVLAVETPQERVYNRTRNATTFEKRQAIASEARKIERRSRVMRGVGLGFLAASAGTFAIYGAKGLTIESDAGMATFLVGAGAGVTGLTLALGSLVRSPIEKLDDELSTPARMTAGVVPARGGALVGIGGAF